MSEDGISFLDCTANSLLDSDSESRNEPSAGGFWTFFGLFSKQSASETDESSGPRQEGKVSQVVLLSS